MNTDISPLELNRRLSRQSAMVGREVADLRVCIVGVGGIGSNAAHVLASMGVQYMTLVDPDVVQPENIYPGFFGQYDVADGESKVYAVVDEIEGRYGINTIQPLHGNIVEVDLDDKEFDIALVGTDTIASRLAAWEVLHNQTRVWIDARMGGPGCDVYALEVGGPMVDTYLASLVEPNEELDCGMKATAFLTKGYIQGFIGDVVRDVVNGVPFPYHFRYSANDKIFIVEAPDPDNPNWFGYRLNGGR